MPKKFTGINSKALAAKERAKEKREAEQSVESEDNDFPKDDDKKFWKRQLKKEQDMLKKQQNSDRKAKAKAVLEEELKSVKPRNNIKPSKLMRTDLMSQSQPKPKPEKYELIEENLNKASEVECARNIDQAILILSNNKSEKDRNPEKRMKAAHFAYEEKRLKELKLENSNLRLSKMKEMIFKEWKTHPDNPKNKSKRADKIF